MRSRWIAALVAAAVWSGPTRAAGEALDVQDTVVAVVNQQVVTRKDVLDRAASSLSSLDPALPPAQRNERVRELLSAALRSIVDEKLLVAEGTRLLASNENFKKRIEEQLQNRIEEDRRRAGGETAFQDELRKERLSFADYTERTRSKMLQDVVLYQFVLRDLTASPRELLDYYRENLAHFRESAQVKYRQIFIRAGQGRSREQAKEFAEHLLSLLRKQYDFARLAEENSEEPHAKEGGLWDFTNRGARPKPIDDLLFSLPVGEVGGPVETEIGFTIVKVEQRKEGRTRPFEEVQGEIERTLVGQKRVSRYAALIRRLEEENYVEILP